MRLRLLLLDDDGAIGELVFYTADILLDSEDASTESLCDHRQSSACISFRYQSTVAEGGGRKMIDKKGIGVVGWGET